MTTNEPTTQPCRLTSLTDDLLTPQIIRDIQRKTELEHAEWMGDWWAHPDGNPQLSWLNLIGLAFHIQTTDATKLIAPEFYRAEIPTYSCSDSPHLTERRVSGAKRINAHSGTYLDFTGAMGIEGLFNPHREEIFNNPPQRSTGDRFRLSGKDQSCTVEGTWWDWICFANNILASENTKNTCPDAYQPTLKNENY